LSISFLSISFRAIRSTPRNFLVEPRARFREVMGNSAQMVGHSEVAR
jgi:hypothetical protein